MNFQEEFNGYNKKEVDAYIERLKASNESKLMEERLKTLEAERRLLDLRNQHLELRHKEKNILDAIDVIEKAKKFEEEGTKSFYALVFDKLQLLVQELEVKFPHLKNDKEYETILDELTSVIRDYKDKFAVEANITNPINSPNDSMRLLLNKMQEYKKGQDFPREVRISTNRSNEEEIPPYLQFLQVKPEKSMLSTPIIPNDVSESGFSFQEALNPKEDLEEIMKAFDFYNEGKNDNNSHSDNNDF